MKRNEGFFLQYFSVDRTTTTGNPCSISCKFSMCVWSNGSQENHNLRPQGQ